MIKEVNKSTKKRFNSMLVVAMGLAMLIAFLLSCNKRPDSNALYAQAEKGKVHYEMHCVSCHGVDGKGVTLDTMTTKPADLTTIQERWSSGDFPVQKVAEFIDGRVNVKAHGPRSMPAWGDYYAQEENLDQYEIRGKMGELIAYIMSMQE